MIEKKELRKLYKSTRESVSENEKNLFDSKIFTFLINSELFKKAEILLIYVSVCNEIDTYSIINFALSEGKKVAVPYCVGNMMNFLVIDSLNDLVDGKFGIPTADPEKCLSVENFGNALCIVPALSFDNYGNRLGYGGGFYDRFLCINQVKTVGLCYERCISNKLPIKKNDIAVDYIINENGLKAAKRRFLYNG